MDLAFDRTFAPHYGRAVEVTPLVRRVTAENPGPFTFLGTNSFIVGHGRVAVVDPGPDDPAHRAALLRALAGETVSHILVTHSHLDHVGGAAAFASATRAPIVGRPPVARPRGKADGNVDYAFQTDVWLNHGSILAGEGWTIEAIATPGHLSDHLCFALREEALLLCGDHVMAWSTSVVSPPHGSMRDYRASLSLLLSRPEDLFLPAHGPMLRDGRRHVRALLDHRTTRERAILGHLADGPATIAELVAELYPTLEPGLQGAAAGSVEAHLIELAARGAVGPADGGRYRPAP